jgi:hypothetical protein
MIRTKKEIMQNVTADTSRVISNNTIEYTVGGTRAIRLHDTDIIVFDDRGGVTLNTGGWETNMTKNRINALQNKARLYSDKGIWYAVVTGKQYVFEDGMRIGPRNGVTGDGGDKAIKARRKKTKHIKAYCDAVAALDELPEPSGGDCFICQARGGGGDAHCLQSHLDETYIHGTLIVNAMRSRGYDDTSIGLHYRLNIRGTVVRSIRQYLRANL